MRLDVSEAGSMIISAVETHAAQIPHAVAVRAKRRGIWRETTWEQLDRQVSEFATGLEKYGAGRGSTIALLAENRAEWVVAYLAIQRLGAVLMPIPGHSQPTAVAEWLKSSDVRIAICGDQEHVDTVVDGGTTLELIVAMDPTGLSRYHTPIVSFEAIRSEGQGRSGTASGRDGGTEEIIDGEVVFVEATRSEHAVRRALAVIEFVPGDRVLSLAPLDSAVTRSIDLGAAIIGGATIHFPETPATVAEDLREVRPTVVSGPRRAYELLQHDARIAQHQTGRLRRALMKWAYRGGAAHTVSPRRWLVLGPIGKRHGLSKVRCAVIVGEERTKKSTLTFLQDLGVRVLHAWGPNRGGGLLFVENHPSTDVETGSLTDAEMTESEIWRSQFSDEPVTDSAIEAELREHACIRRAVIASTGATRVAFFELDFDAATLWAAEQRIDYGASGSIASAPALRQLIRDELSRVSGRSAVQEFVILPRELSVGAGTLTSAGEVVRSRLIAEFSDAAQSMDSE